MTEGKKIFLCVKLFYFFAKAIDKSRWVCYNVRRNKEKFRFHPAARRAEVNSYPSFDTSGGVGFARDFYSPAFFYCRDTETNIINIYILFNGGV